MKMLKFILISAISLIMTFACGKSSESSDKQDNVSLTHRIQNCSKIYSSEYQVSKIIIHRDEKRIKGKFLGMNINWGIFGGKRVIAIPIHGVLKGYVDLADIREENIITKGDSITILLPDPKIVLTSTRVSNKEIREKVGWLQSDFSDEDLTKLQQIGRDSLIREIPSLGLIENARLNSARTLISLLMSLGYDESKITIRFNNSPDKMLEPANLGDMIVNSIN